MGDPGVGGRRFGGASDLIALEPATGRLDSAPVLLGFFLETFSDEVEGGYQSVSELAKRVCHVIETSPDDQEIRAIVADLAADELSTTWQS